MKYLKIFSLIGCMFLLVTGVKAATREELLEYMPEFYLDSLSEEQYNAYLTLDVSKAVSNEAIYKDKKYPDSISPLSDAFWETTYKKIKVTAIPYTGTVNYAVTLDLQWKYIPAVTSYDVIALRFDNMGYDSNSVGGTQYYMLSSGVAHTIGYKPGGTNMVQKTNGYGISMNIVDDDIKDLQCFTSVNASVSGTVGSIGTIYGAYEHAVDKVSLSQSQNYNISYAGMGRVINFAQSVWDHYDDMDGVFIKVDRTV